MQTQQFMSNLYNTLCYILLFRLQSGWQLAMASDALHFAKTNTETYNLLTYLLTACLHIPIVEATEQFSMFKKCL